jgi:hypothetical protein
VYFSVFSVILIFLIFETNSKILVLLFKNWRSRKTRTEKGGDLMF